MIENHKKNLQKVAILLGELLTFRQEIVLLPKAMLELLCMKRGFWYSRASFSKEMGFEVVHGIKAHYQRPLPNKTGNAVL